MDWSLITIALSNSTDPQKGRRDCDAGLLFRGNVLVSGQTETSTIY